ncbi:MAG: histidine kinase, partial [Pseudomonadales bacterium]|nr:histidine kinase [Pseudomonadales bacterium]
MNPENGNKFGFSQNSGDAQSLSSNNIISLLRTKTAIWIGTLDSGINRYDSERGTFTYYTKADGLASDAVYGMLEDDQGRIWVSGSKGLSVFDPDTERFTIYDSTHGLQNDDFNSGAFFKMSDGTFLFGGNNGFNAFDPDKIEGNEFVPQVRVTAFTKFNKPVELSKPVYELDSIEIEYNDSVIGFEFAAMDFTAPEKNQYQYKLEGFDQDWVDAGNSNQVTYTNLDPGNYTFRVRGSNNDGVWNEEGVSLGLQVLPPIWATWWAYVVYFLAGLGALYQAQRANERRLRHEAEKRYSARLQLYIESLEEATDGVLLADENKNLLYANHA